MIGHDRREAVSFGKWSKNAKDYGALLEITIPPSFRRRGKVGIVATIVWRREAKGIAMDMLMKSAGGSALFAGLIALAACTTVKLEGGDKPIEVNLNVKIDQEVRVKLDKEIEDLIANNPDIF